MPKSKGFLHNGVIRALSHAKVTPLGVGFGSSTNQDDIMLILQANRWLKLHDDRDSDLGQEILHKTMNAFYPGIADWGDMSNRSATGFSTRRSPGLAESNNVFRA